MNDTTLSTRIEALESRITHQEASLDEITRTLLRQELLLNKQLRAIEILQQQLQSLTDAGATSPGDETPPHY